MSEDSKKKKYIWFFWITKTTWKLYLFGSFWDVYLNLLTFTYDMKRKHSIHWIWITLPFVLFCEDKLIFFEMRYIAYICLFIRIWKKQYSLNLDHTSSYFGFVKISLYQEYINPLNHRLLELLLRLKKLQRLTFFSHELHI